MKTLTYFIVYFIFNSIISQDALAVNMSSTQNDNTLIFCTLAEICFAEEFVILDSIKP